jgi:signal transduction histidine kinase
MTRCFLSYTWSQHMKTSCIISILCLCLISEVLPQTALPVITQYSTDNGLPQNSVKKIAFDKWGFCWMATEMGLVRFDGRNFAVFGTSEIKGLRSERMQLINTDTKGNVYILSEGGQILTVRPKRSFGIPVPAIISHKSILLPTQGFASLDSSTYDILNQFYRDYPEGRHYSTYITTNGQLYLSGASDVLYLSKSKKKITELSSYSKRHSPKYALVKGQILISISNGNNVEAWEHGILLRSVQKIRGSLEREEEFIRGNFIVLINQSDCFIYANRNLHELTFRGKNIISELAIGNIDVPTLGAVYHAREQKKYYLGSYTDGLFVIQKPYFSYPVLPKTTGESFYSQARINDSTIFCQNLIVAPGVKTAKLNLNHEPFAGVEVSQSQQLYFQKSNLSLARYDFQINKLTTLFPLKYPVIYLRHNKADDGSYFFFTQREFGKAVHDSLYELQPFPHDAQIKSVAPLGKGNYLVGTNDGLKWYDSDRNKIYQSVLESMQVRAILPENDSLLWISTYGKGFYLLMNNKLHKMPFGPKQALKTVHSFINDRYGFFWLPTNNGLFKVRKADLIGYAQKKVSSVFFFRFDRYDGLKTNEFNGGCDPSYVWLKDSLLSISCLKGLMWFYPNRLTVNYPSKPIYIDSLSIDNKLVSMKNGSIELPPDFIIISMLVLSPFFGNPANLHLEYRIDGLDPSWHPLGDRGLFTLNNLPAGDYKLLFRRSGIDNPSATGRLSIPIKVLPWFYNTTWFRTLTAFMIFVITYLIFRRRIRLLKAKSEELEKIVNSRTHELKLVVEDLANSEMALLESNRFKDHVITMVLHDMRSPIRFISLMTSRLYQNHARIGRKDLHESLSDMFIGTQNLLGFTEQFFLWVMMQQKGFKTNNTWFSLQDLFDEIGGLYNEILKINHNHLVVCDTKLRCHADYQVLSVILRNLIDNANKNMTDGRVFVSTHSSGAKVTISISDSGPGLNKEQILAFMDRKKEVGKQGTGSLLIHRMLDHIKGSLDISSEEGKGSTFSIIFRNPPEPDAVAQDD